MADTAQLVKEKLSIADVVAPYVKLSKAGKYMRGLSPFTKEKTPSFYVWPERGSYYCFSTGQGGDHFTFIEKMEGVDFKGALKILADKAGVEIVYERGESSASKDRTERLRDAMSQAVSLFAAQLAAGEGSGGAVALEYAKNRGLTAETIASWQLGFARDSWRTLLEQLQGKGFTQAELIAAGLVKEADGKPGTFYDRFRNRLMFPIRDLEARTVAFTGRTMKSDENAKYLNSPETLLYKKSDVLFGMDKAKDSIRTRDYIILVEGQFDLLLLHQIGFTNSVAISGTALTANHLKVIKRYTNNIMLCLDSDRAGIAASEKSTRLILGEDMDLKALPLPKGNDVADVISGENGKNVITRLISNAPNVIEFFIKVLFDSENQPDYRKALDDIEKTVVPLLSSIKSPIKRERATLLIARKTGISENAIRQAIPLTINVSNTVKVTDNVQIRTGSARSSVLSSETRVSVADHRGASIRAVVASYPESALAEKLKTEYTRIIGAYPDDPVPERALFEAGLSYGESPTREAADDLLHAFEKAVLAEKLQHTTDELRRAEAAGDTAAVSDLLTRSKELSAALARF